MITHGPVLMLLVVLTLPLSATRAQDAAKLPDELVELSLCESSGGQMAVPSFTIPLRDACVRCNVDAVLAEFTADVSDPNAGPPIGRTPVFLLTGPFGSPKTLELRSGEPQQMLISCPSTPDLDQQAHLFARPEFAQQVANWQQARTHDPMPTRVGSLRVKWTATSGTCETPLTDSRSTDYVIRTCPTRSRFPVTAAGGLALLSWTGTNGSLPRHEVFLDDRNSSIDLQSIGGSDQALLLSPNARIAMGRTPSALTSNHLAPPIDLEVAVWVLDGKTTREEVQRELETTNAIYARSLTGVRFRLASLHDTRDASARGQLLQERLREACPNLGENEIDSCPERDWPALSCEDTSICDETASCKGISYKDIEYDPSRINVYYGGSVFGQSHMEALTCGRRSAGESRERHCSTPSKPHNVVLLSRTRDLPGLLAHELGHVLGLGHPNPDATDPCWGQGSHTAFPNNLMLISGLPRKAGNFLTPAQVLMAYTSEGSWLRKVLDNEQRSNAPVVPVCPQDAAGSTSCIPLYTDSIHSAQTVMQLSSPPPIDQSGGGMESLLTLLGMLFFMFLVLAAAVEVILEFIRGLLELKWTWPKQKVSLEEALRLASEFAPKDNDVNAKIRGVISAAEQLTTTKNRVSTLEALEKQADDDEKTRQLNKSAAFVKSELEKSERRRVFILRSMAAIVGLFLCFALDFHVFQMLAQAPEAQAFLKDLPGLRNVWFNAIVGGLAAAAGSSYWHDQLDKVRNLKAKVQAVKPSGSS